MVGEPYVISTTTIEMGKPEEAYLATGDSPISITTRSWPLRILKSRKRPNADVSLRHIGCAFSRKVTKLVAQEK